MSKPDPSAGFSSAVWRKSSRSSGNGACVEVAAASKTIALRDSKNPAAPYLTVDRETFRRMIDKVKTGRYAS